MIYILLSLCIRENRYNENSDRITLNNKED